VTPLVDGSEEPLAARYDVCLLDLDGVLYVGPDAVPGAPEALRAARTAGMRAGFVTNNASRTPERVAAHLTRLGIPADADDVVTSGQAAASLVAAEVPPGSPVLVVGGEGLEVALRHRGLRPVSTLAEGPVAVVQGFSPDVGWRLLAEGAHAVRAGLPWIASNLDLTVPTPQGPAPGNGALVGVIAAATGRRPVAAGKPELPLHEEAMRRTGARRPLVVGDRLDTDIEGANRAGVPSLLVLTGVTGPADLLAAGPGLRPTYVSRDLTGLLTSHAPVRHQSPERWSCGGWSFSVGPDGLDLTGRGDVLDAVRVACVAVWAWGGAADLQRARALLARLQP